MLTRVFVVIALLTCNLNAAPLQPSPTSQNSQDLQVITFDSQGNPAMRVYYSYDQLLTLPTVTVRTERDLNTNTPATYTGIYFSDLFAAFGHDASFEVIGANCIGGYKQYYDRDYVTRHRPILLLKFDDKPPADWPKSEQGNVLGPYCVVHESFSPTETIYGYVEEPRNAPRVTSLELTSFNQSLGHFAAKESANDPEVVKGQKIVIGSCISCHNAGKAGGHMADASLRLLGAKAATFKENFRKKVIDPRSTSPFSRMPPHPTFDDDTFNALEAYLKAMMVIQ
jgi:mono/diheme cytochrome c family protein